MQRFLSMLLFIFTLGLTPVLHADVTEIDNASLQALIDEGVSVIDIRREDEWRDTGVVEGSHLITFFDAKGRYDVAAWMEELKQVASGDEPVILICARGVRSSNVAKLLDRKLGYTNVHNVTRGINDWIDKNQPVQPYQQ